MAKYELTDQWSVQANVYNALDKKYASRNTGWWGGAYTYGEPRKLLVSMDYRSDRFFAIPYWSAARRLRTLNFAPSSTRFGLDPVAA